MKKDCQRAEIAALRWVCVKLAAAELKRAPLPKHAVRRFQNAIECELANIRQYAFAETTSKAATLNGIDHAGSLGQLAFDIANEALGE